MKLSNLYNPLLALLLKSPFHRLASQSLMLVTVSGRRSGRRLTLPVNYLQDGDTLFVLSSAGRSWWRNLRGGAPVRLRLDGRELSGSGDVLDNEACVSLVLKAWMRRVPAYAGMLGVRLDQAGRPDPSDLVRAAAGRVVVRFRPNWASRDVTQSQAAPAVMG
jgi:hypothetical protein